MTTQAEWQQQVSLLVLRLLQEVHSLNPGIVADLDISAVIAVADGRLEAVAVRLDSTETEQ